MAEDEMSSWLHHYTEEFYSELLDENQTAIPPPQQAPHTAAPQQQWPYNMLVPPQHPPSTVVPPQQPQSTLPPPPLNFQMFSRMRGKGSEATPSSTVVESVPTLASAVVKSGGEVSTAFVGSVGRDSVLETGEGSGEMTVSSSLGTSGDAIINTCSSTVLTYTTSEEGEEKMVEVEVEDRKRKQPQIDHSTTTATSAMHYQDVELDAADYNMIHSWGLHPIKRTRAAEVHNLSERKRRDRINEKMKALQELVPRCNKSDKASMLDEVIEYLKSLQMQLQMMSIGCGMVPVMYPGMQQQYMGMSMGMGMRMFPPIIPFPSNTTCINFRNSPAVGTGPQNAPNFNIRPIRMPSVVAASNTSVNQGDFVPVQNPNLADSYQQYMALQQMQMQMQVVQDQSISLPGSSNNGQPMPSTSKSEGEDDQ